MKRRAMLGKKRKLIFFEERFLTSTDWTAPPGCTEVDVFLVGGGAGYVNGIGGSDGSNGGSGSMSSGGQGQGHTTREFGEPTGKLYSSGGSTNNGGTVGTNGADNTGNAGGGQGHAGGKGGSGIVIIRGYKYA